jgi:hypothetical protein
MRGVVFTELIEFVEEKLGFEIADKMIEQSKLAHGGVFTQGGNYPFEEMVQLLTALSNLTGESPETLLEIFGEHLFNVLVKIYGKDIKADNSSLDFIDSVEHYVHVEVKKLYPDAELPTFTTTSKEDNKLIIIYQSEKKLDAFALGLIKSCGNYFGDNLQITKKVISQAPYQVEFTIIKD